MYIRTLKRAAELVGGEEQLARRLKVAPTLLDLWILGVVSPQGNVFLKAVDIVTEHDMQQLSTKAPLAESDPA